MKGASLRVQRAPKIADIVYSKLHEYIIFGHFKPGQRLTEESLAQQMEVSRTPVREALSLLEQEGLIKVSLRQGAVVRELTMEEAHEVYQIRPLLEGLAARLAAEHCTQAQLDEISAALERSQKRLTADDVRTHIIQNNLFHELILDAANNALLKRFLSLLHSHVNLLRITLWSSSPERLEQTLKEHRQIFEAIAAGDGSLAERLAREHIEHAWQLLRPLFAKKQGQRLDVKPGTD